MSSRSTDNHKRTWIQKLGRSILPVASGVLGVSLILILAGFAERDRNPFQSHAVLDFPQFAVEDDQNRTIVIDTSLRRILVADQEGELISEIRGGDRREGRFFYADLVLPGEEDSFFILNYVLDDKGTFIQREEILEYGVNGDFRRILYQRRYDEKKAEYIQRGEIFSPRIQRGYLYFFLVQDTGIQFIRKSLERETTEILGESYFPDANAYVADIEWVDGENYIILDKRGHMILGDIYSEMSRVDIAGPVRADDEEDESFPSSQNSGAGYFYDPGLPDEYFWDMTIGGDDWLYVSDLVNRRIAAIPLISFLNSSNFTVEYRSVLDRELLSRKGYSDEPFIYYRVGYSPNGFLTTYDYGVYGGDANSRITHSEKYHIPPMWRVRAFLWWTGLIAGGLALAALVVHTYIYILKRRISLVFKQLLIIVPLMAGGIFLISTILLSSFIDSYEQNNIDTILALTQTIGQSVDGDLFHEIRGMDDYMNAEYQQIRNDLRQALNYNLDSWNEGLYFALYQVVDENLYGFMYLNNRIGLRHPFNWYEDPQSVYRKANEGDVVFEQVQDISGNWLYGVGPIYDSSNQVVALLEIGSDLYSFNENARELYSRTMMVMTLIAALIVVFIMIMTVMILRSLRILRNGVERIAEGDWDYQIRLTSNDEVSDLGKRFNFMSRSINTYLQQIENMNESYRRFFPDQFLKYLDLSDLTEVKLGDQVQKTMTIMFSDIRRFTAISESMSPDENFNFLNAYLSMVGPVIRERRGFIDKYIGDAIMALFPDSADDAVQAAVAMITRLNGYNREQREQGQPEIRVGAGIHTGDLMLGILGDENRMQGTVISDSVNLAARLETLSKQMGASIIVSSDALEAMSTADEYLKRYMGRIQVVGRQQARSVYEILNGLPEEEIEAKLRNKQILNDGVAAFEAGNMQTAYDLFMTIREDPFNRAIADLFISCIDRYHIEREEARKRGREPEPWDGILRPQQK
ncbi:adenylate/guanylate cyclase domain-containing protein [Salinispira pacifica]|uniref:Adenylate cyclase n=1 Tax=Salinispira pacifica TaxID=1307761 RepID=V5WII1_9SPIO|nr:adenylate/guanylate cyclase domain-containing protein [Salinispira pacifica]AHC15588.1 Adenylate cyclase [Salinispira pacifica]